jgi:hypothetical protein
LQEYKLYFTSTPPWIITYLHPIRSKEYVWLQLNALVLGHRVIAVPLTSLFAYGRVSNEYGKFIFVMYRVSTK